MNSLRMVTSRISDEWSVVSSTFVWKIDEWDVRPFEGFCQSPGFSLLVNDEFRFHFNRESFLSELELTARNSNAADFSFNYECCLIDHLNKEHLKKSGKVTTTFPILNEWRTKELYEIYGMGGPLIIQCTLSHLGNSRTISQENRCVQTEDNTAETKDIDFLKTLSSNLEMHYKDQIDTDCVLKTEDKQFPAHRAVLSSRSKFFHEMFHHDTNERRTGEVNIHDVESIILSDVLYFIYTGKVRGLSPDKATRLYTVADKYAIHDLRQACLNFLLNNLNLENVLDAAVVANTSGEKVLEEKVFNFVVEKFKEVQECDRWKTFALDNQILSMKYSSAYYALFKNAVIGVYSEVI